MILVDTSVWIEHLARRDEGLRAGLERGVVWTHAFVIGELACGNLRTRRDLLALLRELPQAPAATEGEAHAFLERHELHGAGTGWIDVHLLASAALAGLGLRTRDRRLAETAAALGLLAS